MSGGLRIVTESVPGARSTSVGVWVGVGSVDETPRLAGASHYLEHLLFKGTRRRTGQQIARMVDAVGGELNAFTSHEYTCYYAHVLAEQAALAVDVVCDVVLDARVTAADVDTERSVILEEIAMRDDDPEETLADAFAATVFAGHPVADPVIGTAETIEAMTRTQVAGYYRRRYTPDRMVVAVAGRVDHARSSRWVREAFGDRLDSDAVPTGCPRVPPARSVRSSPTRLVERDIEQAHLCLGRARTGPRRQAAVRLGRAVHRARRWDELATVPHHPRGERAGLLVLRGHLGLRGRRVAVGVRRVRARQPRRRVQADRRATGRRGQQGADRRGTATGPPVSSPDRWCSAWRTPSPG